jgi:hypothetical protein
MAVDELLFLLNVGLKWLLGRSIVERPVVLRRNPLHFGHEGKTQLPVRMWL